MSKPRRGKSLWSLPGHGRGTCPLCARTGVKLLYPLKVNGETVSVCKRCRNRRTV